MMTPRQRSYFEKVKERAAIALLIERFDAVPIATEQFKRNEKIRERVDALIDQIEMAPKKPRYVFKEKKPWDAVDLSWVKPGEVPF